MAKRATRQWRINAVLAIMLMIALCGPASVCSATTADFQELDVVYIDLPQIPGSDIMPGVPFPHDRHTRALGNDKDCSACHLQFDTDFFHCHLKSSDRHFLDTATNS